MSVLLVFGVAITLGILLIALIAIGSPKRPLMVPDRKEPASLYEELNSVDLAHLVMQAMGRMGIEVDRWQGGPGEVVEIYANNPTPVTGGSVLIHCVAPPADTGMVDGRQIGRFIRATRSAYVNKGLFFTGGRFSPDAHLEADGAPVELFDGKGLEHLLSKLGVAQ